MKQIAYPSALSATLGITEPAVFGVTLRLGKPSHLESSFLKIFQFYFLQYQ